MGLSEYAPCRISLQRPLPRATDRGKAQRKSLGSRCAIGESLTCHACRPSPPQRPLGVSMNTFTISSGCGPALVTQSSHRKPTARCGFNAQRPPAHWEVSSVFGVATIAVRLSPSAGGTPVEFASGATSSASTPRLALQERADLYGAGESTTC